MAARRGLEEFAVRALDSKQLIINALLIELRPQKTG